MENHAPFKIVYERPGAAPGVDDLPGNPLARALTPLMEMDKLLPEMRFAFLAESDNSLLSHWLGVFVASPGGRILFIPGLDVDLFRVEGNDSGTVRFDTEFDLDHISLERNRRNWHITSPKSKAHQGGPIALDIGENRVLWFGMSVQSLNILRKAKRRTEATFLLPDKAVQFKRDQLDRAVSKGVAVKVILPPKPEAGAYFPLFTAVVGPRNSPVYRGPEWGNPYASDRVTDFDQTRKITPSVNQFPIDPDTDLQVTAMWITGRMSIPVIMVTPKP